ncbi:putative ABC transporter periplasmic sugar-binding protein [uncultured Pleomorphomonas sp.]|uniref:LacI family transcriptional regulator n=2 Tax=Pleomorphomonas TaxID=261933 RepID=A0A2G9WZA7_9HYPH|nr:substrate-binding domain-containing protein [Pleomorphomonas carboxyditropha]PIP00058.1 LacI family transcriptional regulator [Pleomorphomonas carboxyditropha]SCM76375.1 putative ABC transporter periplasmic sugar-binding protein [uncultured Pleomorphomonas sp.]
MKRLLAAAVAASFVLASSFAALAADAAKVGVVVKIGGIPWFNAMEAGIKEKSAELGIDGFMIGPTSADPALQVRAIEDLIAQNVKVIGVVPNDAKVLEPVLNKAREQGIIVITHESPSQKGADWDFELASAQGYGEAYGKLLADLLGGEGGYAVFVGSLTVPLHNAWADAAIAYIKANHPDMKLIGDRYGVAEDVDKSRSTALDLMAANPDLKGFLGFGSQGPIGAARAVEERRSVGKVKVLGPFSPGQGQKLLMSGALSGGFMWNPKLAGEVFITLADKLIKGEEIKDGDTIEGLGVVHPDFENRNIIVDQLVSINKDTVAELAAMGL